MIAHVLVNLLAVIGAIFVVFLMLIFVVSLCNASSTGDRKAEDEEQAKYIQDYLQRKGEKH